jgi:membrane protease YdiL (CAAX protease family)
LAVALVVAAGCGLLVLRPVLFSGGHSMAIGIALFALLAAVGLLWPSTTGHRTRALPVRQRVIVLGAGIAAFGLARVIGGGEAPAPFLLRVIALNSLAAVAEEAFFRKLAFDALRDRGPIVAVAVTSILFAVVHVTVYGFWVLPLDLAAGLVLGWQRWAGDSWTIPAATHVVANLLVVLP